MQVKCITLKPFDGIFSAGCRIVEGGIYSVVSEETCRRDGSKYYELAEDIGTMYAVEMFEPYNPYSNSVSKELAEKAMSNPVEVDQPVKIKEPALS